jgi:hypothetical protein
MIQTNDVKINANLNQEDRREQLLNQAQKKLWINVKESDTHKHHI